MILLYNSKVQVMPTLQRRKYFVQNVGDKKVDIDNEESKESCELGMLESHQLISGDEIHIDDLTVCFLEDMENPHWLEDSDSEVILDDELNLNLNLETDISKDEIQKIAHLVILYYKILLTQIQ